VGHAIINGIPVLPEIGSAVNPSSGTFTYSVVQKPDPCDAIIITKSKVKVVISIFFFMMFLLTYD